MSDDGDRIAALLARTESVELSRYVKPCHLCEAERLAGGVPDRAFGWYTEAGLVRHRATFHGGKP